MTQREKANLLRAIADAAEASTFEAIFASEDGDAGSFKYVEPAAFIARLLELAGLAESN